MKILRVEEDYSCCGMNSIHGFFNDQHLNFSDDKGEVVSKKRKADMLDDISEVLSRKNRYAKDRCSVGLLYATTSEHQKVAASLLEDKGFTPAVTTRNPNSNHMITLWVYDFKYECKFA